MRRVHATRDRAVGRQHEQILQLSELDGDPVRRELSPAAAEHPRSIIHPRHVGVEKQNRSYDEAA